MLLNVILVFARYRILIICIDLKLVFLEVAKILIMLRVCTSISALVQLGLKSHRLSNRGVCVFLGGSIYIGHHYP